VSRIDWNKAGERFFETGVDRGVLYPRLGQGVPWNGLVAVNENAAGGEVDSLYFDGVKYLDIAAGEDFEATIEALNAPLEFAPSDGQKYLSPGLSVTQQPRKPFGFSYRTLIGNDLVGTELGYKLHLVYNCTASPAARSNKTLAGNAEPGTRSWKIDTVPPAANTFRPTAHIVVDSTLVDPYLMEELETMLYGRDASDELDARPAYLPTVSEIILTLTNPITDLIEATI
jgi:hypothetical protein